MSDATKGVWLTGYTEEPYKMILFGRSTTNMEVVAADLLPDGKAFIMLSRMRIIICISLSMILNVSFLCCSTVRV
jgi:hypothetical protein